MWSPLTKDNPLRGVIGRTGPSPIGGRRTGALFATATAKTYPISPGIAAIDLNNTSPTATTSDGAVWFAWNDTAQANVHMLVWPGHGPIGKPPWATSYSVLAFGSESVPIQPVTTSTAEDYR